jgi:hypothetical protein
MKTRKNVWVGFLILGAAMVLVWIMRGAWGAGTAAPKGNQVASSKEVQPEPQRLLPATDPIQRELVREQASDEVKQVLTDDEREQTLAMIEDAATSYDPRQISRIQPFLEHSDPEIRSATIQGLITLGDPAAAPVLRAAAGRIRTADLKEAIPMIEAADYLELPPASLVKKPK